MRNEDKVREEFTAWFKTCGPDDYTEFGAWKACAAIKDAEIAKEMADHKLTIDTYRNYIEPRHKAEIAARDLMIKELREALNETIKLLNEFDYEKDEDSDSYSFFEARLNEDLFFFEKNRAKKALANSEHHNSRALEKMLLESEIAALEDVTSDAGRDDNNSKELIADRKAKLAELNKE